jgi:CubicO group peptidase (beta-lactamase class C family)
LDAEHLWRAATGYGYGLAIWHDDRFGYGVSHGGGLPGYGSYFYLLPENGIGVVALSNKTYARVGMIFPKIFDALAQTGGLLPRAPQPAPILMETFHLVQHWLETGDDARVAAHAADNFYLDMDAAHRRAEREKIRGEAGAFQHVGALRALNALRGKWTIECERGTVEVFVTLAPTIPPQLQVCRLTFIPSDRQEGKV